MSGWRATSTHSLVPKHVRDPIHPRATRDAEDRVSVFIGGEAIAHDERGAGLHLQNPGIITRCGLSSERAPQRHEFAVIAQKHPV